MMSINFLQKPITVLTLTFNIFCIFHIQKGHFSRYILRTPFGFVHFEFCRIRTLQSCPVRGMFFSGPCPGWGRPRMCSLWTPAGREPRGGTGTRCRDHASQLTGAGRKAGALVLISLICYAVNGWSLMGPEEERKFCTMRKTLELSEHGRPTHAGHTLPIVI